MNALIQAASHGIRVQEATLYSTTFPCSLCVKMLINGGINRVVVQGDYADALAKDLLREARVRVEIFDFKGHRTTPYPLAKRRATPTKGKSQKAKCARNTSINRKKERK
jgi:deoxycytidylate deaminase